MPPQPFPLDPEVSMEPLLTDPEGDDPGPSTTPAVAMDVDPPAAASSPAWPEPPLPDDLASDDDEIAHTVPIYISHTLNPNLHLFQYPLHHRPIALSQYAKTHGQRITARMKEKVGRFEVEVPVDQREAVWNAETAENMGFVEVEERRREKGKGKGKEVVENWGTKTRLRGEEVPGVTGYWSGVMHGGALHLHPINRLLQLRPSLGYLDVKNAQEKEREAREKAERGGDDDDDDDEDDGEGAAGAAVSKGRKMPDLKSVQMQMAPQAEDAGPSRAASKMGTGGTVGTTHQIRAALVRSMQKEAEDNWVPWVWEDNPYSEKVMGTLAQLVVPAEHGKMLECKTKPLDVISKKNIGQNATL